MLDSNEPKNLNIIRKIHTVRMCIDRMKKDGRNDFHKYAYLTEAQISETFKNLFDDNGIVFLYSSSITDFKHEGLKQPITAVNVDYSFIDIETGERIYGCAAGQGCDAGDKGVYKAITGAIKYIFMKTFLIPTGDDPENDKKTYKNTPVMMDSSPFEEDED